MDLGGQGLSVDLAGAADNGFLIGKEAFAFEAGDVFTLTIDAAGDQRGGGPASLFVGFEFDDFTLIDQRKAGGGFGSFELAEESVFVTITPAELADTQPFTAYTFSFRAPSPLFPLALQIQNWTGEKFQR